MPTSVPVPTKNTGDVFSSTMWNSYLRDNINKLLDRGHRVLTVAQFVALTGPEGTKGTVAPDEAYVEVDATAGVVWHVIYESTDASSSKWRCISGAPLYSFVATSEATTNTGYVDLTTVGPSITVPRLGDYEAGFGTLYGTGPQTAAVKLGAAATSDNDGTGSIAATSAPYMYRSRVYTGFATNDVVKVQYRSTDGGSRAFSQRSLTLRPLRIG